jgi:pimeloyl-ACP methyl ester carboxylesterase
MSNIYKSDAGERAVRERYGELLKLWPVPHERLRLPTRQGETFVIASGEAHAPPVLLLHGSMGNCAVWLGEIAEWAKSFRVYAVDVIGEPGFSAPSRPPLDSDAYALWLDDVLSALSLERTALFGVSLGGWLALDFATRSPERVTRLALMCPSGVGRQKIGFAFQILFLRLLGRWGAERAQALILGRPDRSEDARRLSEYIMLIDAHFRPRLVKLPIFSVNRLKRLTMPVLAVVGGKDVLLDSAETRRTLERIGADVRYLPEAGHFIPGQTAAIIDFLRSDQPRTAFTPNTMPRTANSPAAA